MKRIGTMLLAGILGLALAGCAGTGEAQEIAPSSSTAQQEMVSSVRAEGQDISASAGEEKGEKMNRAMYIPFGSEGFESYVLVDQDTGAVFTVTMPEELYGLSGEKISPQELKKGNILEITGNGIMLESYPGQYPGVTKIRVVQEGKPEDAGIYQELIDQLWQEPDLSEPPTLSAEYRVPEAAVAALIPRGGWEWDYEDENGELQTAVACGSHPLQWGEILEENSLNLSEPADIRLLFYPVKPDALQVLRWSEDQRGLAVASDIPQGETVTVEKEEGDFILRHVQAGFLYQVQASFPSGQVEYAFLTK